jgi:hypothetical protein
VARRIEQRSTYCLPNEDELNAHGLKATHTEMNATNCRSNKRMVRRSSIAKALGLALVFVFAFPAAAIATPLASLDEPGMENLDQPGVFIKQPRLAPSPARTGPRFRVELGFGLSSLVVDPDAQQGIGGGLYVAYGLHSWIGVEASLTAGHNPFKGQLGDAGTSFSGLAVSVGPIFQLTPPSSRFSATIDLGIGAYWIVPIVQDDIWTLGVSMGTTLGFKLTSWFGIGIKIKYHLFNLATLSGPDLLDLKSFQKTGVVDRLEVPGYVAFYF